MTAFLVWIPILIYLARVFLCYYVIADEVRYPHITLSDAIQEARFLLK